MSNTIYSIQEKLDSILDIKSIHTIPDAELFDLSDYPNGGKSHGYFSWLGMKHTEETKQYMSETQYKRFADSGGHSEERIVIETSIQVGDRVFSTPVTLTSREDMLFRMNGLNVSNFFGEGNEVFN